jgi:hypothetical protein
MYMHERMYKALHVRMWFTDLFRLDPKFSMTAMTNTNVRL